MVLHIVVMELNPRLKILYPILFSIQFFNEMLNEYLVVWMMMDSLGYHQIHQIRLGRLIRRSFGLVFLSCSHLSRLVVHLARYPVDSDQLLSQELN